MLQYVPLWLTEYIFALLSLSCTNQNKFAWCPGDPPFLNTSLMWYNHNAVKTQTHKHTNCLFKNEKKERERE